MRRFFALVFGLGLLGDVAAILVAPPIVRYWFTPPIGAGAMAALNATDVLNYGMTKLIEYQIGGTLFGMALGALISFFLWRRARRLAALQPALPVGAPQSTAVKV